MLTGAGGGYVLSDPTLDASGKTVFRWGGLTSGQIVTQAYGSSGWSTTHSLDNVPSAARNPATVAGSAGNWTAAAWTATDAGSQLNELWVQVAGPGMAPTALKVSGALNVALNSARVAVTADGGVTVIWVEEYQPHVVTGRLVSRHWSAASGWGAVVEQETNGGFTARLLLTLADGSSQFFYETEVPAAPRSTVTLRARPLDAAGNLGAPVQLDDPSLGVTTGWGVHAVSAGSDVVAAWLEEPADNLGGFCLVSRTLHAGSWSAATCVNAAADTKTLFQPRLVTGSGGQAAMAWFGGHGTFYEARLQSPGQWSVPVATGTPSTNETGSPQFDLAVCRDGSTALAWHSQAASARVMSATLRSAAGVVGDRLELGRSADPAEAVRLGVDDACNWTALWSTHGSSDALYARRVLASGGLQAATPIAEGITLPSVSLGGSRYFTGRVGLSVEPAGPAVAVWDEATGNAIKWRRLQ